MGLCPANGGKWDISKQNMVTLKAHNLPSSMSTDGELQISPGLVHFWLSLSY